MARRVPLLIQVAPVGPVTKAPTPIPVFVTLEYRMEAPVKVIHNQPALALAWTAGQVLIRLDLNEAEWWIPATNVHRQRKPGKGF